MIRVLLIIVCLVISSFCQAQDKRVKQIDCYHKESSSTPDESYLYVYDENGRLIRVYDEANYNRYQQELVFEYDDIIGKITIKGLMPGYKGEHDDKGTEVLTITDGRITNMLNISDEGEYACDLSYNSQGEWTGLSMGGETVYQTIWENGNMVKMIAEDDVSEVTAFTDIDYPSSFPFFYVPGMEYDAFSMPSALYHFSNLFGKRHAKLPASVKTVYDSRDTQDINYSYTLDGEGNIMEIVQTWVLKTTNDYERLVFHYEDATSTIGEEKEAYAVLSDDGKTVTFYYDGLKASRKGVTDIQTKWDDHFYRSATTAVFDNSFADYRPISTAYWFNYCEKLTHISGIEYLHTDNVTNMEEMFSICSALSSLDVTHFNTENVTNMRFMFLYCHSLTSLDVTHFNTEKVINMGGLFCDCESLTSLDVTHFNTKNVTKMHTMFSGCSSLSSLDVTNFDTENVTLMDGMFQDCKSLTSIDLSNFNTENVTDMNCMFNHCYSLTSIDLSNFNTKNITDMNNMFAFCRSLTSIDLSNFNTENVTDMSQMFCDCNNLSTIYCGDGWSTGKVTDSRGMFSFCTKLVGGNGTVFDVAHTDHEYARVDKNGQPGYLTYKSSDGIDLPSKTMMNDNGTWYKLDGSKMPTKPVQNGIYVLGGRKVIMK